MLPMRLFLTMAAGLMAGFAAGPAAAAEQETAVGSPQGRVVATLGPREVLLKSGQQGLKYFPDGCLAFVQTAPTYRVLLAATISSYLLEGADMQHLVSRGEVLRRGQAGSFDNGYAGICGVARDPQSRDLLAIYHAEDQEGMPPIPGGIPGFYCSLGMAVSKDDGRSFEKLGPVITSSQPKRAGGRADQGCGEACLTGGATKEPLLWAYYTDHSRLDGHGVQICLARCRSTDRGRPHTWKKFYQGAFDEPGLGGRETPVMSAQALPGDAINPQVSYVGELASYVMVFNIVAYQDLAKAAKPAAKPELSGIYIACSPDGIRWSKPTQLLAIGSLPIMDQPMGGHPALLVTSADRHEARGWLYYAYSDRWGHKAPCTPHYLVGQPIRFSIVHDDGAAAP
jgi:hypothetical protein